MCRWRSWILPGLIAVSLLTAMAMVFKSASIETDLTQRATAGLAADAQGWATVSLDGRDATLQGTAPSPEAKILAMQSADRVFGVRVVDDGAALLPEVKPYRWSATRGADGAVTVGGFVPDEATRKAVLDAVVKALPGATIKDEQKLARGAPAGLLGAAGFAAQELGKLAEGTVSYQDQALSAIGRAATIESHADVKRALAGGLPAGYSLALSDIAPPNVTPYVWSAALAPAGVTLSGLVPSDAARA
jgi:OmpA-OmpF porin, OOP family